MLVFATVAVKGALPPAVTVAVDGFTATDIGSAVTVTVELALAVGSATLVAMTRYVPAVEGAV